jgi:hypothetical protein
VGPVSGSGVSLDDYYARTAQTMAEVSETERSFRWTLWLETAGWVLRALPIVVVALFLWYYLPGYDVVRIVDTDVKRMDVKAGQQAAKGDVLNRDVRFINAVWPDGTPRVYRNEETGWGFPWYMKFDSQNLQAKAQDLRSTGEQPTWVLITHYGWRIEMFSAFPNALEIEEVAGPEAEPIPWFNIGFLVALAVVVLLIWGIWRWFVERHWLPVMRRLEIEQEVDVTSGAPKRFWAWLRAETTALVEDMRTGKGKPRRK